MRTALVLAVALLSVTPPALRAGVAMTVTGTTVLAIGGPSLTPGTQVTLVATATPQEVHLAAVVRDLAESAVMAKHLIEGPYYEIATSDGRPLPAFAVAVPGQPPISRRGSSLSLRIDPENPDVRVRSCASHEGLHLTLWSGEPLKGRRLWHQYFYLGYDVEPTCEARDIDDKVVGQW